MQRYKVPIGIKVTVFGSAGTFDNVITTSEMELNVGKSGERGLATEAIKAVQVAEFVTVSYRNTYTHPRYGLVMNWKVNIMDLVAL